MLVVNAANTAKDYAWIAEQVKDLGDVATIDSSSRYALISIQGPAAEEVLQTVATVELDDVPYYGFTYGEVNSARATIARTGYTGEDGFEIFVPPAMASRVWQALLEAGRGAEVLPCGLGARDTLRLEAGMNLYGQDMDESVTPLESGLAWTVDLTPGRAFVGREALLARPPTRRLVGLVLTDAGGVLRAHQPVHAADGAGETTSGTFSPTKRVGIALLCRSAFGGRHPALK